MKADEAATLILSRLRLILGSRAFDAIIEEIKANYCGVMDINTCISERPEVFERALVNIIGIAGSTILGKICDEIFKEHQPESSNFKPINLAGFIELMSKCS